MVMLRAMPQDHGFVVELREGKHARWYWTCCNARGAQTMDQARTLAGLRGHTAMAGHV